MAELNARAHRRFTPLAVLLSALVASTSLTVVFVRGPADADQISSLKAQATALSQQLIREQLQVGAYEQQYSVATAKTAADARAIARLNHQIASDQRQIGRKTGAVRQQAIASYTNYGTGASGPESSLFSGNEESVQAASEYSGIAVGNITTAVDGLRTAQRALQASEGARQRQEAADQAEQAREAGYLAQADDTQNQLEASRAQVTGRLAVAVAQQAAAQAAAAAAAIAAAQRAAAQSSAAAAASSAASSPAPTSAPGGTTSAATGSVPTTPGAGGGATTDPAEPVPPVRGAGRIGRQLCGSLSQRAVHGRLPVQPTDLERRRPGRRSAGSDRCATQRGYQGRPGHVGGRSLRTRRQPAVARRPLQLIWCHGLIFLS